MGGEVRKVVTMDQKPSRRVGFGNGGGGLGARVKRLEDRMTAVETGITSAAENAARAAQDAAQAVANTAELLAIANTAKTAAGLIRKHGPKLISFGAGVFTILGIGNPKLWQYIAHFVGG